MAIIINATITTDEGFEVTNAWGWIDQYMTNINWANLRYYKSKADFQSGKQPLSVSTLPNNVPTELTNDDFWSANLAEDFHNRCISAIEAVTGANTCTIDKTDPFA